MGRSFGGVKVCRVLRGSPEIIGGWYESCTFVVWREGQFMRKLLCLAALIGGSMMALTPPADAAPRRYYDRYPYHYRYRYPHHHYYYRGHWYRYR